MRNGKCCGNCVYYIPSKDNNLYGICEYSDNARIDTDYNFDCHRWVTNEHKYDYDGINKAIEEEWKKVVVE